MKIVWDQQPWWRFTDSMCFLFLHSNIGCTLFFNIDFPMFSNVWAPNASDLQRLRRNDRAMIRWICGAKLADKIPTAVLHQKLDLDEITAVFRTRRLRWYGHVQRATSFINSITRLELPGTRDRGRPRKTWSACVRNDMTICNLDGVNRLDRNSWRTSVRRCQVLPTPESGTTAAP